MFMLGLLGSLRGHDATLKDYVFQLPIYLEGAQYIARLRVDAIAP
jgi:hypothetical protein